MNLHAIVAGAIGAVNPFTQVTIRISTGYTTDDDGTQIPSYAAPISVSAQVQNLTQKDIEHLDSLNVQGSQQVMYLAGNYNAIVRVNREGGDLIMMPNGDIYLTTQVLEQWPDWVKLSVTLQNGS